MDRRVANLETKMEKVQDTLNSMQVTLARIETTMATKEELKKVEFEVAEMKGRIAGLPSTAKIAGIVAIIGAAIKIFPWFSHYQAFPLTASQPASVGFLLPMELLTTP